MNQVVSDGVQCVDLCRLGAGSRASVTARRPHINRVPIMITVAARGWRFFCRFFRGMWEAGEVGDLVVSWRPWSVRFEEGCRQPGLTAGEQRAVFLGQVSAVAEENGGGR